MNFYTVKSQVLARMAQWVTQAVGVWQFARASAIVRGHGFDCISLKLILFNEQIN